MPTLFDPLPLGPIAAPNRILMAPLTRARSGRDAVPTPVMAEYYSQRAGAGLIISEATGISREGLGWPDAPGLWNDDQVEGWKPVTDAVHRAGGRIVAQLWHMGRVVHSSLGGAQPVSASAIAAPGDAHTYEGKQPYETPRMLEADEIARVLDDYAHAARNAQQAGFDGVQLHGANGYLIDQFLRETSNHRSDAYGGSVENRVRLLEEATDRLIAVWGADRVSVRLSPNGEVNGVDDSDPATLFGLAAERLSARGIAFLELREGRDSGTFRSTDVPPQSPLIRQRFAGPLVLNGDYGAEDAAAAVESGAADAVSFGRLFIANPDLPARLRADGPYNPLDTDGLYAGGAEGYTDYPALAA